MWANVHGGFLVAFVVLGCHVAGTLLTPRGRPLLVPLLLTSVVSFACILINPWGWRLPRHLISFFASKGPALRATTEFAPAAFDDRAGAALLLFLALCAAGLFFGYRARSMPLPGTLLALSVTAVMALLSIRHVEVLVVFGALVISGGASAVLRLKGDPATRALLEELRVREVRSGGGPLLALFALLAGLSLTGGLPRAGFDPAQFPVGAVAALKVSGAAPEGPVFSADVWGGYLILEWPQARVYVDGRWDMYGDDFFMRYADIYLAHPGWPDRLREAGVNLAILPRDAPLAEAMRSSVEWELLRADGPAEVFRRRAAGLPA